MADSKVAELLLTVKTAGADAVDKLGESFDKVKELGVAAFAAISAIVVKSIAEYAQQEEATNALSRAMVNNGVYSKELKEDYLNQADALSRVSTFGNEQITNAEAILQSYLGQTKVSKDLVKATLDLATAKKMDLASAAEAVGKSIGTSTDALRRDGIEVTANASMQQKLGEVLQQVESRWGGQAKAATEGLGGLKVLENVVSDLFQALGERLAPVVVMFTTKLRKLGDDTSQTSGIISGFVTGLRLMTDAGAIAAGVFEYTSKVIGTYLGGAIGAVQQLLDGKFKQAWETTKTMVTEGGNAFTTTWDTTTARIKAIDDAFLVNKVQTHQKEEQLQAQSLANQSAASQKFSDDEAAKALDLQIQQQAIDIQLLEASEENRARVLLQTRIKAQENVLKNTVDAHKKLAAEQTIYDLNEQQKQVVSDQRSLENKKATFATIATLANSSNSELAAIGKAAGITQIAIDTPVAVSKALAAFPPPFNFVAAGLVATAMAAQAAQIAGVKLATGGIVRSRPGGVQATIGEGGQDEMVIPLDRAGEFGVGGGGGMTITFTGPVLGDQNQAREFALALDRELLKLRQNHESVSFDSGVT